MRIRDVLTTIDNAIGGSQWFVILLLGVGLFYTIYLKFPQFRFFRHAVRVMCGKYDKPGHKGDASHFQALTTALSGTIGTGNIAGVALAIHLGGPPALFWMLITAFFGMATKMVEVTLSHKYREINTDGTYAGGPMYYMKNRLHCGWLAAVFAVATILCAFGTGCLPQINSISNSLFATFGFERWVVGAVLSVLLFVIIIGGVKRIVKVSEKIVPSMAIIYLVGAISVIVYNYTEIIPALHSVFSGVFTGSAAAGGFLGAGFVWAFNRGVNRGLFSNEAGQGSAPIAHAAARTDEPVSEGIVALLEPFIDTIIVCFLTGLTILTSGVWKEKIDNQFQSTDMVALADRYHEDVPDERKVVADFFTGNCSLPLFSGTLEVTEGELPEEAAFTLFHNRSFAEDIRILGKDNQPYSGPIHFNKGILSEVHSISGTNQLSIYGRSLVHSAPLSSAAFSRGLFGDVGRFIIPIVLLLFAFSTTVAWSYYGDRAVIFLFGNRGVLPFRLLYVVGFFLASFTDTSLIWLFSGIAITLMTLPNLIGILLLHRDVRSLVNDYWSKIKNNQKSSKK